MSSSQWFPGLMAELHHMKQDLMRLHFAYSPVSIPYQNALNFHHLTQTNALNEELRLTQGKLGQLQSQGTSGRAQDEGRKRQLQRENE